MDYERWERGREGRVPNLTREFAEELSKRVKLEFVSDGRGDLKGTFGPAAEVCGVFEDRFSADTLAEGAGDISGGSEGRRRVGESASDGGGEVRG